jgi:predicted HicB family RNase H-like nuclease
MRPTVYAVRTPNDERLTVTLPEDQKRAVFDAAARQGVSVGHLVRRALAAVTTTDQHAAA